MWRCPLLLQFRLPIAIPENLYLSCLPSFCLLDFFSCESEFQLLTERTEHSEPFAIPYSKVELNPLPFRFNVINWDLYSSNNTFFGEGCYFSNVDLEFSGKEFDSQPCIYVIYYTVIQKKKSLVFFVLSKGSRHMCGKMEFHPNYIDFNKHKWCLCFYLFKQ